MLLQPRGSMQALITSLQVVRRHTLTNMPTIEKIQETWTPTSITTLFRLCSKATIACSLPLRSPIAGRSWSLLLRAPTVTKAKLHGKLKKGVRGPLMCQLFFKFSNCDSAWHGAPVNITLSFPSHPDGDIGNSPLSASSAALVFEIWRSSSARYLFH